MSDVADGQGGTVDSGLLCLVLAARLHGLAVNPTQLVHHFNLSGKPAGASDLVRAARFSGLKARIVSLEEGALQSLPLPAILACREGGYQLMLRADANRVLVQRPGEPQPVVMPLGHWQACQGDHGILLTRRHQDDCAGQPNGADQAMGEGRFGFRWFLPAIWKYRSLLGEVLVASCFVQLFALLTPLFFQVMVDKVLVHRGMSTLDVLAFGMLVIALFEVVLSGLRSYILSHTSNRIDVSLGSSLFRHLLSLPLNWFEKRRVGNTAAHVRELETIRQFLTGSAVTLVIDLLFSVIFLGVMWLYSPLLTAIVLGSIPVYVLLSWLLMPALRERLQEKFSRGAENQALLVETIGAMPTVKSMAVEPVLHRRWDEQLAAYVTAAFRAGHLGNICAQSASLVGKVVMVLTLWVGARLVMEGQMSVGQLIAFNMLANRISAPILRLVQMWQEFQQVGISLQRLGTILNTPGENAGAAARARLPALKGGIRFDHVSFRYEASLPAAVDQVSFSVKPGEIIGIVGRSGSGKSTLTRLLQRLYVPQSGRILVDGVDLSLVDPAWLRRQMGVVLQDNVLFDTSIRENIAFADPGLGMEQVIAAAKLAGAHEFILALPRGYDTVVGEGGASLSGGQRQRIAIARALVTRPGVLIFDEATSALDYETETVLQRNLPAICRNRTVLIIAHRLTALRRAHRILVMDNGRIVEQGNHQALLAKGGLYARLHALQSQQEAA